MRSPAAADGNMCAGPVDGGGMRGGKPESVNLGCVTTGNPERDGGASRHGGGVGVAFGAGPSVITPEVAPSHTGGGKADEDADVPKVVVDEVFDGKVVCMVELDVDMPPVARPDPG